MCAGASVAAVWVWERVRVMRVRRGFGRASVRIAYLGTCGRGFVFTFLPPPSLFSYIL